MPKDRSAGHPAWKEILDAVPEQFHEALRPTLERWDRGVQDKIQGLHDQYSPYKEIIDNEIDPEDIEKALSLAYDLNQDPEGLIQRAVEAYDLDFVRASEVNDEDDEDDEEDEEKMTDSRIDSISQQMEQMMSFFQEQKKKDEEAAQRTEFENTLEKLREEHGDFDEMVVTAFMSQGLPGSKAVKRYQEAINQAAEKLGNEIVGETPPAVPQIMGSTGTSESGIPVDAPDFGSMKNNDLMDIVSEMLSDSSADG